MKSKEEGGSFPPLLLQLAFLAVLPHLLVCRLYVLVCV